MGRFLTRVSFTTVSGFVGYSDTFGNGWTFGAAGQVGAAYFFSPHVNLGVSGELSALYSRLKDTGAPGSLELITVRFSDFRLLGAVYF